MTTQHTPTPWRMHDMERATVVAGKPGGEVANCLNGFGDQDTNAAFIVRAANCYGELLACLRELNAIVIGESPSILNEDSGGDGMLAVRIDDIIAKAEGK